ncbi:ABC transporter substrate-binding protein [Oceanicella actignis]|uniref:ABC transporter substrate-binding protein n=1 Tax=Oceanicella actignis TaxID=1189325 RepID=UPI0011E71361|nr:ABC transporter substrate-binding protein [Oceanicella actignis]TYO89563.1 ABC transporter substrate binding protein (PQQ-dependent alcohol dehydrogenase system) [Oceanicella actignis]
MTSWIGAKTRGAARLLLGAALALGAARAPAAQDAEAFEIVYLERAPAPRPVLSNLDPRPADLGLAGARLGVADNAAMGRFLGQSWRLSEFVVPPEGDFAAAARAALARGAPVIANAPAEDLLALADMPEAAGALIFNAAARDDALRRGACRANVLHTIPSRAMLADALAQFLVRKRWTRWFVIEGRGAQDRAFADAMARAAAKFGARIVERREWPLDADIRRTASSEAPLLTQAPEHDVLILADEADDWDRYIPYNTFSPRPVAGTEGMEPVAWSRPVEAWGAAQLQSRFRDLAGRDMTSEDYAAWAAARAVGEAVTRLAAGRDPHDPRALRAHLLSGAFEMGGFKGRKLSFRAWNGQLRQPIPLTHPRALVAQAPIEGFLHRVTELDTLGYDQPEAGCAAFEDKGE